MEYTVQKLSSLAGVSGRTLRYYDEIGLLKPARISSSGYRIYGAAEVDRLQQIMFFRELGLELEAIRELVTSPSFDAGGALRKHYARLLAQRAQLDRLIANVEKTIANREGRIQMSDKEKFEGFKKKMIEENEEKYGAEVRQKYGDDVVDRSNQKVQGMSPEDYEAVTKLGDQVIETLLEAFKTGNPAGELAQRAADLHKQWLTYFWHEYTKEAHAGVAQMYVDDERFTAYYDQHQPGLAAFLRDAVHIYTGMKA